MHMGISDACEARYALHMTQSILASNIVALRNHLGLKQAPFAEMLNSDQPNVSKWERGVVPGGLALTKLAKLAGCSVDDFVDKPWKPRLIVTAPDTAPNRDASSGETVEIIQLDLTLPMGAGATVDDYVEEEPRVFDLAYIRGFTKTPPSRLRLARGVGDSMWPTLHSYDQVWIDSTQRTLDKADRVWAVSINGGAAIKRLRPLKDGRVLVISDNPGPGHENYEVDAEEILLGGRVIRFARDI